MKRRDGRIQFESVGDLPPIAMSLGTTAYNHTGAWKYLEPFYQDQMAPCADRCRTGADVATMLRRVEVGDWRGAALELLRVNPFPSITGRVCPHDCETPCNRKALGGGVQVRAIERAVGDRKLSEDIRPDLPPIDGPPVAIVGSGPAGLSAAYYLRMLGHPVTILESRAEAGGRLRHRLPAFRMPAGVVAAEVEWLERCGVTLRTESRLEGMMERDELRGFEAVILALGLGTSRLLNVPGEDHAAVLDGARYLADARLGRASALRGRVAVVGGGATAVDAARTALRLGAEPVIWYRRGRREMGAYADDLAAALDEGIAAEFLTVPTRIEADPAGGLAVSVATTALGAKDASGRRAFEIVPGSARVEHVTAVIRAAGERLDNETLPRFLETRDGVVAIDEAWQTSIPRVFACGECAGQGGDSVGEAIRSGRLCAHAVAARLRGTAPPAADPTRDRGVDPSLARFKDLNMAWFQEAAPLAPAIRAPQARRADVEEIEATLSEADARAEAARCFKCGTCTECCVCRQFCPDFAISPNAPGDGYSIDLEYCKGCGVCVEECPRSAIHLRRAQ